VGGTDLKGCGGGKGYRARSDGGEALALTTSNGEDERTVTTRWQ